MVAKNPSRIDQAFDDPASLAAGMRRGVDAALDRHKRLGESIAIWEDDRVVIVPPDQIDAARERAKQRLNVHNRTNAHNGNGKPLAP